jgi:hypothetical protein
VSASGVVILLALIAGGMIWFRVARGRTRRRDAALARLAPLISGAVSSKDKRLRGSYGGHDVEAWVSKYDPTPTEISVEYRPDEVIVFHLGIGGVSGRESWSCRRQPRLNPFAPPEYTFDWSYGGIGETFSGLLGKVVDVPEHDPELEQLLRGAGLIETIDGFGHGSSPYLPHVRYAPALRHEFPLPPSATREPQEQVGQLLCVFELERETDPTAERFRELLDRALRIVDVNASVNPIGPQGSSEALNA